MQYYPQAILRFHNAIGAGYQSINLFNNLGFCDMQIMDFSEADRCFRNALSLNPRCSTALHNLVKLAINRFDRKELTPSQAAESIDKALDADGLNADLLLDISVLEAKIAKSDPSFIPRVFEHLKKAISLGADPRRIAREAAFKHLREEKEFSAILALSPGTQASQTADAIMPPF